MPRDRELDKQNLDRPLSPIKAGRTGGGSVESSATLSPPVTPRAAKAESLEDYNRRMNAYLNPLDHKLAEAYARDDEYDYTRPAVSAVQRQQQPEPKPVNAETSPSSPRQRKADSPDKQPAPGTGLTAANDRGLPLSPRAAARAAPRPAVDICDDLLEILIGDLRGIEESDAAYDARLNQSVTSMNLNAKLRLFSAACRTIQDPDQFGDSLHQAQLKIILIASGRIAGEQLLGTLKF